MADMNPMNPMNPMDIDFGSTRTSRPTWNLDDFAVLERVGAGGQGTVYKAIRRGTDQTVAIKILGRVDLADESQKKRFQREIRLISQMTHPNIVSVYQHGDFEGCPYFAMEYIEGLTLDAYILNQPQTLEECMAVFLPICEAVAYAHRKGIIHRDLKPSNVLVDRDGVPHVVDFGLARSVGDDLDTSLTDNSRFHGTLKYAAPEQVREGIAAVDTRADVYALGMILYEILTLNYPYPLEKRREAMIRHILETRPEPPSRIMVDVDRDLETVILKALHKEPDRRYPSAAELETDLRRFMRGQPIEARRDSPLYRLRKTARKHKVKIAVLTTCCVILVGLTAPLLQVYNNNKMARHRIDSQARMVELENVLLIETAEAVASQARGGPRRSDLISDIDAILADKPDEVFALVTSASTSQRAAAIEWLGARDHELQWIGSVTGSISFAGSDERADHKKTLYTLPPVGDLDTFLAACDALAAHAVWNAEDGDSEVAAEALRAGYSLASDLGKNAQLVYKDCSLMCFDLTLQATSRVARSPRAGFHRAPIEMDQAHLPTMKDAIKLETARTINLLGTIVTVDGEGRDVIDTFQFKEDARQIFDTQRRFLPVNLDQVSSLIHEYYDDLMTWKLLDANGIAERDRALSRLLRRSTEGKVLRLLRSPPLRLFSLRERIMRLQEELIEFGTQG